MLKMNAFINELIFGWHIVRHLFFPMVTPSTQSNLFPKLTCFPMLKLTKFPPLHGGGGFTVYYTSHVMNRFIPHAGVHRARSLNGFEIGLNLAENRIEYV